MMNMETQNQKGNIICISIAYLLLFFIPLLFITDWDARGYLPSEPPKDFVSVETRIEGVRWKLSGFVTDIRFEYDDETITDSLEGNAFARIGDTAKIYYNPETKTVLHDFPTTGELISHAASQPTVFGVVFPLFLVAAVIIIKVIHLCVTRKNVYVTGVITDMTTVRGEEDLTLKGKMVLTVMSELFTKKRNRRAPHQRFIVTCTFTSPDTGEAFTAIGTNDYSTELSIGDSVTVIYNKANPEASIVDVDGLFTR